MSMRPKMCYYKMHENIQSAYWPDVSGVGLMQVKVCYRSFGSQRGLTHFALSDPQQSDNNLHLWAGSNIIVRDWKSGRDHYKG